MKVKPLRIGVDLTGTWRRPTGIFRYTAEMARHLLMLPEAETPIQYVFFFAEEVHGDFLPFQEAFETVICPTRNELISKQLWFPGILPRLRLDVMHYPTFPPPYIRLPGPQIVMTFYDAGPWRYPQAQTSHGRIYFRTLLSHGIRTCSHAVTLSKHAKSEIGHFLGNRYLSKIAIAPGAVRPEFGEAVSDASRQMVRDRYDLPDAYFLTVATVEPRKNLPTLLDAYTRLRQRVGEGCPELVIVGRRGWNCENILRYMTALQESVHFLGHVPDLDLIALYQMARCFVFPSLYEGFGLPVVEAMTAGCPVITTNSSSLPEVAGDATVLVDPLNAEEMAGVMKRVLEDEALRHRMVADGRVQASHFSWEETARIYREVYLSVAGLSQ